MPCHLIFVFEIRTCAALVVVPIEVFETKYFVATLADMSFVRDDLLA